MSNLWAEICVLETECHSYICPYKSLIYFMLEFVRNIITLGHTCCLSFIFNSHFDTESGRSKWFKENDPFHILQVGRLKVSHWFMDAFKLLTWPCPSPFYLWLHSSSQSLHGCSRQILFTVNTGLHMFRLYCYFSSSQFLSFLPPQCHTTSPYIQVKPFQFQVNYVPLG